MLTEARNIPAGSRTPGIDAPREGRPRSCQRLTRSALRHSPNLFARPLSFIGPAEYPAALHFGLGRRRVPGLRLRLGRRSWQIPALHRVDQFSVLRPSDRRAVVDTCDSALGRQFRLRPGRRRDQQNCKYEFFHRRFAQGLQCLGALKRIGVGKSIAVMRPSATSGLIVCRKFSRTISLTNTFTRRFVMAARAMVRRRSGASKRKDNYVPPGRQFSLIRRPEREILARGAACLT